MDSYLKEDDLDEEQARRSILVTNIPANLTYKDVIIHFQKERNGGGEVDSAMYPDPRDKSAVVVTFDEPQTVDKTINRTHQFGGCDVSVERYPVAKKIPEVFDTVHARLNHNIFTSRDDFLKVVEQLQREFGVTADTNSNGIYITGSLQQIQMCHDYVLFEVIPNNHQRTNRQEQASAAGATNSDTRFKDRETDQRQAKEISESVFQTVPILMMFMSKVSKYKTQLDKIEEDYDVRICQRENGEKVAIKALRNCTEERHEEACETYITLYRKVFDGSMMSKEMLLYPGHDSMCPGGQEAVAEILQHRPVIIQKTDTKDTWLFYGEEKHVKAAIKEVCKLLNIEHPFKRSPKQVNEPERQVTQSTAQQANHDTDSKDLPGSSSAHESDSLREELFTKKGFKLSVCLADITEEQVDVIVNYNDEYLRGFASGLPKLIINKGGNDIADQAEAQVKRRAMKPGEIIVTGAGNLRCSKVMHIITWSQKKSKDMQKNMVKDTCLDCLRKTQTRDFKSIAFPAFKSKVGLPLPHCATAMVNAVEEYMRSNDPKRNAVADIRFVHVDPAAFEVFTQELKKRYGDCFVKSKTHDTPHPAGPRDATPTDKSGAAESEKDVCPICLEDFTDPVPLQKCKHQFCRSCIDLAFKHSKKCPTCGVVYGVQTGNMPKGTMNSSYSSMPLPGHRGYGSITITYSIPNGTQGQEHPNPGQYYTGAFRTAYLPNSPEGQEVLRLLKKAFDARLTFTIGTSVTTGTSNTVTWNDIHHKTNTSGGSTGFGYPDPGYLKRVKEELAAKGIS